MCAMCTLSLYSRPTMTILEIASTSAYAGLDSTWASGSVLPIRFRRSTSCLIRKSVSAWKTWTTPVSATSFETSIRDSSFSRCSPMNSGSLPGVG